MDGGLLFDPICKREGGLPGIRAFGTKQGAAAKRTSVQLPGTEQKGGVQPSETPQQRYSAQNLTCFSEVILSDNTKALKINPFSLYVVYKYLRFDAEQ